MNNTKAILIRARELIYDPEHWTQMAFARDVIGASCEPENKYAASWCARGAVRRAAHEITGGAGFGYAVNALIRAIKTGSCIMVFNDMEATHADLIDTFNRAIDSVEDYV